VSRKTKYIGLARGAALLWLCLTLAHAAEHPRTLYVRAGAVVDGDGTATAPFASLAAVETASEAGDEIVVLPVPLNVPPLDGGIALKPHQKLIGGGPSVNIETLPAELPRITNTDTVQHSGDAVVLADDVEVRNLVILNAYRGGIYGSDVNHVEIHDNNLAGTNTSCTPGFYVYFPGDLPLLANGWAAIMVDEDKAITFLSIEHNYIHDGTCHDGIDIRATGSAQVAANVSSNTITRIAQGPAVRSVLAIGLQTRNAAVLTVVSDHNSETYIGSPDADCEGLFVNQTSGVVTWSINHNTFAHGIGGISCNGAEFYNVAGTSTANLYISHSLFEDNPGDMIEEDNGGDTGSVMSLTLDDVTIRHATFAKASPPEPKFITGDTWDNLGRCMDQFSWGHENFNILRVIHSRISDCAGDAIGSDVTGGVFQLQSRNQEINLGDAVGDSVLIDIEDSKIEGTKQYALHFANHAAMNQLTIRVENTFLGNAQGPAIVGFDQDAATRDVEIDLGGGKAMSGGGNCILGASNLALEVTGYEAFAASNWWGSAKGLSLAKSSLTNGTFHASNSLSSPPPACKAVH
jgi:hypothetical protein